MASEHDPDNKNVVMKVPFRLRTIPVWTLIITISMVVLIIDMLHSKTSISSYIGYKKCINCHESNSIGNQYKIWAASPHAKAYQILYSEKSREIAKKHSIDSPEKNLACLKCHTTGSGKAEESSREGVGCESCHGPGSLYFEFSNHASFTNRENAYRKAVSLGMYPILGLDGIKAREKVCRRCHNNKRPCLPKNIEERKRQTLPLSLIADFIFKHPVRR